MLNITPDSFSDGGRFASPHHVDLAAIERCAEAMVADGAAILDIGGESTRPGAEPVPAEVERQRVIPVIERLRTLDTLLSVDTRKTEVARAALDAGAHMVNDVSAAADAGMLELVAERGAALCLMHMQGRPETMQDAPSYEDPVREVREFLEQRVAQALACGIDREQLVLDPGVGFGKAQAHNLKLIRQLEALRLHDLPILLGASRKSTIGRITGRDVQQRLAGSLAMALEGARYGANIVRVHDVAETNDAFKVREALSNA